MAHAQWALTPAAAQAGWKINVLTKDAFPNWGSIGPVGITFGAKQVMVSDYYGNVWVLPSDTDMQPLPKAAFTYAQALLVGLVTSNNKIFVAVKSTGRARQLNPDGSTGNTYVDNLLGVQGLTVNPRNGHIYGSSVDHALIYEFDPGQAKPVASTLLNLPVKGGDGITTDGINLFVAASDHVYWYRLSDNQLVADLGYIRGVDGVALGAGGINGYLYMNTNFGQVYQLDLSTKVITLIANGNFRGDLAAVDPIDGSLLIMSTNGVGRLRPPAGLSLQNATPYVSNPSVVGGQSVQGTVTLSLPAPVDQTVTLTSSNPAIASVPSTVVIPAGASKVTYAITTKAVRVNAYLTISAALNGVVRGTSFTVTVR